jgi:hypothetical protein
MSSRHGAEESNSAHAEKGRDTVMKSIAILFALLTFTSVGFAQSKPTAAQCEADQTQWWSDAQKNLNSVHALPLNTLIDRENELNVCVNSILPKPSIFPTDEDRKEKDPALHSMVRYSLELEERSRYTALSLTYLEEAAYRFEIFIRANQLDEKFWHFDAALISVNY